MTSKLITTSIVGSRATEKHFTSYSVLFKYSLIYAGYMLLKGCIHRSFKINQLQIFKRIKESINVMQSDRR